VANRRSGVMSAFVIGLAVAGSLVAVQPAAAQSTIMNIPTTDTVAPGKGYFEFDYLMQLPRPEAGGWQTFAPRVVVGITPMIEAGANYSYTTYSYTTYADDAGSYKTFQPNVKIKFYNNDDAGVAAAAGLIGYIAGDDQDDFGQIYGNVSKKIGTGRVHGGVWSSLSYGGDDTAGVLAGYEQLLGGRVSFVVDWLSGQNFWGYLTPGISIAMPRAALLNIGYTIGNNELAGDGDEDYRNNQLFVYYGITFP
jgi:hypothetical protein